MKINFFKKELTQIFFSATALLLLFASCNKALNDGPIDSTYGDAFWVSQANVEKATVALYGQFRADIRQGQSYFIFGDLPSGTFLPAGNNSNFQVKASTNPPFNFSYVPYKEGDLQDWSRFYKVIAQANLILENVPKMSASSFSSESNRERYLGEALFMRAYTYFYMTRVWGDPVYVSRTFNDVDYGHIPPIARSDENQVLDTCLTDLRTAATYLDFAGGDPSLSTRANKGTVYAIMAQIFAWQHKYDSTHVYCQKVIEQGGYAMETMDNYDKIWKGKVSSESIFELPMKYNADDPNFKAQNDWAEAKFDFFGTFLKGDLVDNKNTSWWVAPTGGIVDNTLFDTTNDLRFRRFFRKVAASGDDQAGYLLTKYTDFNYQNPDAKTNAYIDNDLVLIRLADVYLLDAEALANQNDLAGAKKNLEITETRAVIDSYKDANTKNDVLTEILKERGRELIGEGIWYYDLIRTEPALHWLERVGYPADRVLPQNKGYYWPLDMNTLFPYDNLLTQNPWWSANADR